VALLGDEPNAIHTRAWIHMNQGDLDKALTDFDRALTIDPAWPAPMPTAAAPMS